MYKKLLALIFFLAMCGVSCGASTVTGDPYNLYFWSNDVSTEADVYGDYGNTSYNFFYQLKDVTGASRNDRVGGPQWFATVYENYYRTVSGAAANNENTGMYRRTMGGEMPDVTFYTVGDLIEGFNFVFAEEPQPYETAWSNYVKSSVYDIYPDPLESLCIVTTNGQADFNVSFGNPYARHFPFWWSYGYTDSKTSSKWWQRHEEWRDNTYRLMEPVEYILSGTDIYKRDANGRYSRIYTHVISPDLSGDTEITGYHHSINDLSGNIVYVLSGDLSDDMHSWLDTNNNLAYSVAGDTVYDSTGNLAYTLENSLNQDGTGDIYICRKREVYEQTEFSGFEDSYSITVTPSSERSILPGNYLDARVNIRGIDPYTYGSTLGYLTFRQRASFADGYSNYREFISIPAVIANVSDGNASENPLIMDMTIYDQSDNIVNRIKFTWDAQSDMTQDLGTFFMMKPFKETDTQLYKLETRITNRTGTRYELYRYDEIGARTGTGNTEYRDKYRKIMPDYWKYDLTQDNYGTLPDYFLLDAHSQIAPGLVTVYKDNVGNGYSTIDTQHNTSDSFRLYEYLSSAPKNLTLTYKRIAGMTTAEDGEPYTFGYVHAVSGDSVMLQGFHMEFVDVRQTSSNTENELYSLMGKYPAMVPAELSLVSPDRANIGYSSLNAFTINKAVPVDEDEAFALLVSYDEIAEETTPVASPDTNPNPNPNENDEPTESQHVRAGAETKYTSARAAIQPVLVRLRMSNQDDLIRGIWEDLNSAPNSRALFERFAKTGTIWVRSDKTWEYDHDMFAAINGTSSDSAQAADCIRAFIDGDSLYLEFIVLIADAYSIQSERNKTAFLKLFRDDNVPYILIGDGEIDKKWVLTFYVDRINANSEDENTNPNNNSQPEDNNKNNGNNNNSSGSGGGGGGCNVSIMGTALLILLGAALRKR